MEAAQQADGAAHFRDPLLPGYKVSIFAFLVMVNLLGRLNVKNVQSCYPE